MLVGLRGGQQRGVTLGHAEQRAQLAGAQTVPLRRWPDVQLDHLEAVGEPALAGRGVQCPVHLVVPPLTGGAQVAVTEAGEVTLHWSGW